MRFVVIIHYIYYIYIIYNIYIYNICITLIVVNSTLLRLRVMLMTGVTVKHNGVINIMKVQHFRKDSVSISYESNPEFWALNRRILLQYAEPWILSHSENFKESTFVTSLNSVLMRQYIKITRLNSVNIWYRISNSDVLLRIMCW